MHVNVYSSFIHNHDSPKIGNNPNILQLVNEQTVVHPYNRIHLSNKKLWSMDTRKNMYESQMYCAKWNKTDSKGYIAYDCIYTTYCKGKTIGRENISCCQ